MRRYPLRLAAAKMPSTSRATSKPAAAGAAPGAATGAVEAASAPALVAPADAGRHWQCFTWSLRKAPLPILRTDCANAAEQT